MNAPNYYGRPPLAMQPMSLIVQQSHDLEPPRTRISTACNRCRRRKIKCSGAAAGEQCEGCLRAQSECLFADKPQKLLGTYPPLAAPGQRSHSDGALQPQTQPIITGSIRAHSLPNVIGAEHAPDASLSPRSSTSSAFPSSPSHAKRTSQFQQRAQLHPYARPAAGQRSVSGGDKATTHHLARYSQSLMQAQTNQLNGRMQQQQRFRVQSSSPTLMHAPSLQRPIAPQQLHQGAPTQCYAPQLYVQNEPTFAEGPYRPYMARSPTMAQYSPSASNYSMVQPNDGSYGSYAMRPSLYSASTPDLMSSDSLGTISTLSSGRLPNRYDATSGGMQHQTLYKSDIAMTMQQQQNILQMQQQLTGDMQPPWNSADTISDPKQWTPGAEKLSEYLRFDFASSHDANRDGYDFERQA